MLGSQGQLLWRAGALPETLEAGAVGQAVEFRDPGRLTQTAHTNLNTCLLSSVLIIQ